MQFGSAVVLVVDSRQHCVKCVLVKSSGSTINSVTYLVMGATPVVILYVEPCTNDQNLKGCIESGRVCSFCAE